MLGIFETHAHYDDIQFDEDREILLNSLKEKNVTKVLNCAADIASSRISIELAQKYPFVYASVGVHPQEALNLEENFIDILESLLINKKVVAIGEIGLDFHYDEVPKEIQKKVFISQIRLAKKHNLPVIIHDREAHQETLAILKEYKPRGVLHCFSGSVQMAKEIIDLGMYLGFGGVITFKNAKKSLEVLKHIPKEHILLETDSPYLAPEPLRGTRNDSGNIKFIAEKIANIFNMPTEELIALTHKNAENLFLRKEM